MKKGSLEYYIEQFDSYLNGDLNDSNLEQFEGAIAEDEFLRNALSQHVQARANIRTLAESKLKAKFTNEFASAEPTVPKKERNLFRIIIGGMVLLLIALTLYLISPGRTSKISAPPELYTVADPSYASLRSTKPSSSTLLWENAVQSFMSKDYETCLAHLNDLRKDVEFTQNHNGKMNLMAGSCYLKLKQFDKAIASYALISTDNPYYDQRQWYEGITHYYSGQVDQAKQSFLTITQSENHFKKAEAQAYLDRLK